MEVILLGHFEGSKMEGFELGEILLDRLDLWSDCLGELSHLGAIVFHQTLFKL